MANLNDGDSVYRLPPGGYHQYGGGLLPAGCRTGSMTKAARAGREEAEMGRLAIFIALRDALV
jgi:hypothetical protein